MQLRFVILSPMIAHYTAVAKVPYNSIPTGFPLKNGTVACFSCLIPSALSFNLLAAKAVAGQAAQDIVNIGADTIAAKKEAVAKAASDIVSIAVQGVAAKGEALKTAATSVAGAVINGAISIGTTIAKAGLNMIAAKFSSKPTVVYEPSTIVIEKPVLQDAVIEEVVEEPVVVEYDQAYQVPVQRPPISTVSVDVRPQLWDIPAPPQLSESVWTVEEAAPSFEIVSPANSPYAYEIVQQPQVYEPVIETFRFGKK